MTLVHVRLRVPTATGEGPAVGTMWATPTLRRHLETPDRVILPTPLGPVDLVDGECDLPLDATTRGDWCWQIREGVKAGIIRYVLVPDQAEVDYGDLTDVDPTTLDPATPPSPAWVAQLADEASTREAADARLEPLLPVATDPTSTFLRGDRTWSTVAAGITVGPGRDYATIQEAIDNAGDSESQPVTVYVYPGTYARFSMVGSPYVSTGTNVILCRHISIVGINDVQGDVIVRDDSGDYRTPPAEISTVGAIENISFLATHDLPFVDPVEEAKARRSYAVHMEFGPQDVTFRNCQFTSMHAPGVGLGMYAGENVRFRDCKLQSFADGTFGGLLNYGGLFVHSSIYNNIAGQYLDIENTEIGCPQGDKAAWLSVAGDFVGCSMSVRAVGVTTYADSASPVVRDSRITLTPDSGGNNSLALTPGSQSTRLLGVRLPGEVTDYLMTPNLAQGITGDIDLIWSGALDTWASGAFQGLVASYSTVGNARSYGLSVSPIGRLYLTWTIDGLSSTLKTATSTTPIPAANGDPIWCRATLDVDNGAGGNTATFYTSADGVAWSRLGGRVVADRVTSIYGGVAPITVGIWATYPATGVMSRATVKSGIDGTVVASWDGSRPTPQSDQLGHLWTNVGSNHSTVSTSDSTEVGVVQTTDPRLSDARTPLAHEHSAGDVTSGVLAPARLGTGTADAATVLHGDSTWGAIPVASQPFAPYSTNPYASTGMRVYVGGGYSTVPATNQLIGYSNGVGGDDGTAFASPHNQQVAVTCTDWAVQVTNAAGYLRWGIFAPRASGYGPGALIWQSSRLDCTTTGYKVVSEGFTLPAGLFWLVCTSAWNQRVYGYTTPSMVYNSSGTAMSLLMGVRAYSQSGATWSSAGFVNFSGFAPSYALTQGVHPTIVGTVA